ncbi:MAG TPA: hypothetical protein VGN08_11975 [Solirubrobacteraceae bacterium]
MPAPKAPEAPGTEPAASGHGDEGPAEKLTTGTDREGPSQGTGAGAAGPPGAADHGTPQPPGGVLGALAQASTAGLTGEHEQSLELGGAAAAAVVLIGRPSKLSCELSALEGRMPPTCGPGLVASERLLSSSPVGYASGSDSLEPGAATGAPVDGGHGGSAVLRLPASPGPGPAPSGVSGGSAAGTSGLALSGFLTLAGLLLMAAPRALRRLRLSCQPWRTACFVLIPERPG